VGNPGRNEVFCLACHKSGRCALSEEHKPRRFRAHDPLEKIRRFNVGRDPAMRVRDILI